MKVTYSNNNTRAEFNGEKFYLDGQYFTSTTRNGRNKRLHQRVWLYYNAEILEYNNDIPKGYVIHHIDYDVLNNDPSNLQLMTKGEHKAIHNRDKTPAMQQHQANLHQSRREFGKTVEGKQYYAALGRRKKDKTVVVPKLDLVYKNLVAL